MSSLSRIMVRYGLSLAAVVVVLQGSAGAQTVTVSGTVHRYSDIPGQPAGPAEGVAGRTVTIVRRHMPLEAWGDWCANKVVETVTRTTSSAGAYTYSFDNPPVKCCPGKPNVDPECGESDFIDARAEVTITSTGDETTAQHILLSSGVSTTLTGKDLHRAPHAFSPDGSYFARRFGNGPYPIFFIEGMDNGNIFKTSCEACPDPGLCQSPASLEDPVCAGWGELLSASSLGGDDTVDGDETGPGLLPFLIEHGYSFWLITAGQSSGNTIMGPLVTSNTNPPVTIQDETAGQAYQATYLARYIHSIYHPDQRMVIGGHSLGGVVARAGVDRWCSGAWSGSPLLQAGCPELSLWFSADSPHLGANLAASLQRYVKDGAREHAWKLNQDMARELVRVWVTDGCDTKCADQNGCSTMTDDSFMSGCVEDNSRHQAFMSWLGDSWPERSPGVRVPAVTFGVGRSPDSGPRTEPGYLSWEYLNNDIYGCDPLVQDHHLYVSTGYLQGNVGGYLDGVWNPYIDVEPGAQHDGLLALNGMSHGAARDPLVAFAQQSAGYAVSSFTYPGIGAVVNAALNATVHQQGNGLGGWLATFFANLVCQTDPDFNPVEPRYRIDVLGLPTFIPTYSALGGRTQAEWSANAMDWWYHPTVNRYHATLLPEGASRMLVAWLSAYLKGPPSVPGAPATAPVCPPPACDYGYDCICMPLPGPSFDPDVHPYKAFGQTCTMDGAKMVVKSVVNPISNVACSPFTPEVAANGVDDDGDEQVDEAECGDGTCNGSETCGSCAGDCGSCCGDGVCNAPGAAGYASELPVESCATCGTDCGACYCGDWANPGGGCHGSAAEDAISCGADCGASHTTQSSLLSSGGAYYMRANSTPFGFSYEITANVTARSLYTQWRLQDLDGGLLTSGQRVCMQSGYTGLHWTKMADGDLDASASRCTDPFVVYKLVYVSKFLGGYWTTVADGTVIGAGSAVAFKHVASNTWVYADAGGGSNVWASASSLGTYGKWTINAY